MENERENEYQYHTKWNSDTMSTLIIILNFVKRFEFTNLVSHVMNKLLPVDRDVKTLRPLVVEPDRVHTETDLHSSRRTGRREDKK